MQLALAGQKDPRWWCILLVNPPPPDKGAVGKVLARMDDHAVASFQPCRDGGVVAVIGRDLDHAQARSAIIRPEYRPLALTAE